MTFIAVSAVLTFTGLLLFSLLHPSAAATPSEKLALLAFKSSIAGDPDGVLSSWSLVGDPCHSFYGVRCSSSGDVIGILLPFSNLSGQLPVNPITLLPSFQILSLPFNLFTGELPPSLAELPNGFRKLNLSANLLSGQIPGFLGGLLFLRFLDLSGNSFSGEIPLELFRFCVRTRYVSLSHNQLSGPVPDSIAACSRLTGINFSSNNLSGELPDAICSSPVINFVSIGSNSLSGSVEDKLSNCQSLEFLDLGGNSFSGSPPSGLLSLQNLTFFNVSHNGFQGGLPELFDCGPKVEIVDFSENGLSGAIPASFANCSALRFLNLGSNLFRGSIPVELGQLKYLSVLRIAGNEDIGGTIPASFGGIELLQVLDLSGLHLAGEIPATLTQCRFLLQLDLSSNGLEGGIPATISNITYLKILDLHNNHLTGILPASLGYLSGLQFLDLSNNSFSGDIPPSFINLMHLSHLNLSFNNLSGAIPSIIQSFGPTAFSHNPGLCGAPLTSSCTSPTPSGGGGGATKKTSRLLSVSAITAIVAAALILVGVCVITVINVRSRTTKLNGGVEAVSVSESTPPSNGPSMIIGKLVLFSDTLPSKYEDWEAGTKALLDKDCMVGSGVIGTVYKTVVEGGAVIAVKKLETLGRIKKQEEFELEIGKLGGLRHPNLVPLQGYYWSSTMQLLLSEFISNGNLFQHLHSSELEGTSGKGGEGLSWTRRFMIAMGAARALAYLHHDCKPQILHLNFKSSNILVDDNYEAKLSDYGLGKLLPFFGALPASRFHAAAGYVAPEIAEQSMSYSDKCDVYSFGVVLLETVTGKRPVEAAQSAAGPVTVLTEYVRRALEARAASDCFDPKLRGVPEADLVQVLKLGLICTGETPARRPSMAEVVQFLESIMNNNSWLLDDEREGMAMSN